jgi:hypothetical protein
MRYRLRTLLIALAVGPVVLAFSVFCYQFFFTPWQELHFPRTSGVRIDLS